MTLCLLNTGLESHDFLLFGRVLDELLAQGSLYALVEFDIVLRNHANGHTGFTSSGSTADSVNICLGILGQIVVEDDVDLGDIQTTSSNIRSYQDIASARAELVERAQTRRLRELAVEGDGAEAQRAEENGDSLRLDDGAAKDDARLACEFVDKVDEVGVLFHMGDEHVVLEEGRDGLVFVGGDADADGVAEGCALQRLDLGAHGGGEEERPALARHKLEDLVDARAKVHVEKTIGLVHDEELERAQREALCLFQMVDETARCGDNDVRLLSESNGLGNHVETADNDGAAQRDHGTEGLEGLADLRSQFTRGGEDEAKERLGLVEKSLQHGKGKGGCFTTTSLGKTNDVAVLEGDGDGLGLDGGRAFVVEGFACFAEGVNDSLQVAG